MKLILEVPSITFNVHVHGVLDPRLDEVLNRLQGLKIQGEQFNIMRSEAEAAIIAKFNTATNLIAAKIQALITQNAEDAQLNTELNAIADGLLALGANGEPPVLP